MNNNPLAFFHRRHIDVDRVPRQILDKARTVLEKLEKGQPYWKLRGKRLKTDRARISIPLGPHWRILAEEQDGRVHARAVLSHDNYDKLI